MEPGIYENLPFEDYLKIDAVSNSLLSQFRACPARAKYYLDHGSESTGAMTIGSALHTAVLEPHLFKDRFAIAEPCAGKTKAGSACRFGGSLLDENGLWYCKVHGKHIKEEPKQEIISRDDATDMRGAMEAIKRHKVGKNLFGSGRKELTMVWQDDNTGLLCKGRIDFVHESGVMMDLKKTKDASPEGFSKSIYNYGYYRQNAFYLTGANKLGLDPSDFLFLAVETTPPYIVASYRVNDASVSDGYDEIMTMLPLLKECYETGVWPGYADDVEPIAVPGWAGFEIEQAKSGKPVMSGVQPDDDLPF